MAFTKDNNTKNSGQPTAHQNSNRLASEYRIKPLLPLKGKLETIAEVLRVIRLFNAIDKACRLKALALTVFEMGEKRFPHPSAVTFLLWLSTLKVNLITETCQPFL